MIILQLPSELQTREEIDKITEGTHSTVYESL